MLHSDWHILIVEDEPDSLELMQTLLEYHGIISSGTPSAEEAITLLDRINPTLIIIDLALPMLDGWGLLKQLQTNPVVNHVPTVAITAFHNPLLAQKAINAGFDAFIPKPLDAVSFVRSLQEIVAAKNG